VLLCYLLPCILATIARWAVGWLLSISDRFTIEIQRSRRNLVHELAIVGSATRNGSTLVINRHPVPRQMVACYRSRSNKGGSRARAGRGEAAAPGQSSQNLNASRLGGERESKQNAHHAETTSGCPFAPFGRSPNLNTNSAGPGTATRFPLLTPLRATI
jgi:hypothetical protein